MPQLSLIVLRTADPQTALHFYSLLGFAFVEEQHGTGPLHYASEQDGLVLEIYPGKPGSAPGHTQPGAVIIGLRVESIETLLTQLEAEDVSIITPLQATAWGKRAVILDPDGRAVELLQP